MAYSKNVHRTYNDKITLYQLVDTEKETWYFRFKSLFGDASYIRKSAKTTDLGEAIKIAVNEYEKLKAKKLYGAESDSCRLKDLIDMFIEELPITTQDFATMTFKAYWKPYFGNRDLYTITDGDIKAYFKWRCSTKTLEARPTLPWYPKPNTVAVGTLEKEKKTLKFFFRRGFERNLIRMMPNFRFPYRFTNVTDDPPSKRRARLGKREQVILRNFHRKFRKQWNQVLKGKNIDGLDPIWRHKYHRYNSVVFYMSTITVSVSGIRPTEWKNLKFKDIKKYIDENGLEFTQIIIRPEVSKVKKGRDVITSDMVRTWDRIQDYKREWKLFFGREPKDEDLMFPNTADISKTRYLHSLMRIQFKKLNMRTITYNGKQKNITLYSLRSLYITRQLEIGVSIYVLARNAGVNLNTLSKIYDVNVNLAHRKELCRQVYKFEKARLDENIE